MRRASSFAGTIRQKLILFSVLLLIFSGTAYSKHLISQARTNSEAQKAAVNIKVKEESIKQKLQTKKKVLTEPDQNKPEPVVSLATENITAERKTVALSGNAEFRRFMSMILRNADEGQVMSIKDGKLAWMPLTETKSPAQTRNAAPVQINYRGSSVDSGGSNRSSGGGGGGGGGGTQPPKFPVDHNHESGDQAGTLSVGAIASGILPQVRGGTAFNSYTVGDLLLGLTGSTLGKLPIGVAGEVLAVSGSTAAWKNSVLLTRTAYDERYVNTSGDTMTGALTLNLSSGYLGLKILQTASGNYIHSEKTLSSSGGLIVEGTISGSLITQNGGGNNYFMGNVGIGTMAPGAKLDVTGGGINVNSNSGEATVKLTSYSNTPGWAAMRLYSARGTQASPSPLQSGDSIGTIIFDALEPQWNTFLASAQIYAAVDGAAGSNRLPGSLAFYTSDGNSAVQVRLTIKGSGNVGIGTTSPTAKLEVVGSMSGRSLQIAGNENISGSLLVLGTVTYRGTLSGNIIHAEKGLSSSGGLIVEGTISGATVLGSNGVTTKVVSAACSDSNAQATDGTICIDSADGAAGRIYYRFSGAWHYAAGTAGFQVPNIVDPETGRSEVEGLKIGDPVIGRLNEKLSDGAMHGIWEKFDFLNQLQNTLALHPEILQNIGTVSSSTPSVSITDLRDVTIQGTLKVLMAAEFMGDLTVRGTFRVSARQAGTLKVQSGSDIATVTYDQPFESAPIVTATPQGMPEAFWGVVNSTATGFSVRLSNPMSTDIDFSWTAIPVADGATPGPGVPAAVINNSSGSSVSSDSSVSSSSGSVIPKKPFPVDDKGIPFSGDPLWNACIRHITPLNEDGSPVSCSRFALGDNQWEQPDLGITFSWNDNREPAYLDLPAGYEAVVMPGPVALPTNPEAQSTESGATINSTASGATVTGSGEIIEN